MWEIRRIIKQAAQDLEQGNYEAALEEYETAISEGVKPAQSYRGAGVAKLKLGTMKKPNIFQ